MSMSKEAASQTNSALSNSIFLLPVRTGSAHYSGSIVIKETNASTLSIQDENGIELPPDYYSFNITTRDVTIHIVKASIGYYDVQVTKLAGLSVHYFFFIHPEKCYLPLVKQKETALNVQLYALRSERNWGIGDFTDLAALISKFDGGFEYLGLNPIHALAPNFESSASPYSPDSRLLINEIYLDIEKLAADIGVIEFYRGILEPSIHDEIINLRNLKLIDYSKTKKLKTLSLIALFLHFHETTMKENDRFERYVATLDQTLHQAIRARSKKRNTSWIKDGSKKLTFEYFLQWQCNEQLINALSQSSCKLFLDLAVGVSPKGVEALSFSDDFLIDESLGAEADEFCPKGQKWNIAPLDISHAQHTGYRLFRAIVQQNMRYGGALRIDNIASLYYRFTLPADGIVSEGSYTPMPFREFFAILAIESHRNKCIVIGEDLGNVPVGLRDEMRHWNLLGCLIYQLEYNEIISGRVLDSREQSSFFSFSTHDCCPIVGYFQGVDLDISWKLGRIDKITLTNVKVERSSIYRRMFSGDKHIYDGIKNRREALNLLAAGIDSRITALSLDDLLGELYPVNLPGTDDEYPNWRRKYNCLISNIEF